VSPDHCPYEACAPRAPRPARGSGRAPRRHWRRHGRACTWCAARPWPPPRRSCRAARSRTRAARAAPRRPRRRRRRRARAGPQTAAPARGYRAWHRCRPPRGTRWACACRPRGPRRSCCARAGSAARGRVRRYQLALDVGPCHRGHWLRGGGCRGARGGASAAAAAVCRTNALSIARTVLVDLLLLGRYWVACEELGAPEAPEAGALWPCPCPFAPAWTSKKHDAEK
jgi:hypothetical protein